MPSMSADTVRANGLDMSYVTEGQGPPLLLLHGATSTGVHDWGAQRPLLRAEFTLYMPDARGHHRTRYDVSEGWSRDALVDDALAFMDALGLDQVHLMGLSMGAGTAMRLAGRRPERAHSLIAISPLLERDPAAAVARRRMDPESILRDDPAWAADLARRHDPYQGAGAWRRLLTAVREETMQAQAMTPEGLHRIRVPSLLVVGDRDPWVRLEQAVRVKRQLANASLLVVPDCGHVVEAERPSVFNPAMMQFLRRVRAGR